MEDEADASAPNAAQLLVRATQQVHALEHHRCAMDHGWRAWQQAQQRHHGDRLARPAFTDHAEQLARPELKAHAVDGMHISRAGFEAGTELRDLQNRR